MNITKLQSSHITITNQVTYSGRELHSILEVKSKYAHWIKRAIARARLELDSEYKVCGVSEDTSSKMNKSLNDHYLVESAIQRIINFHPLPKPKTEEGFLYVLQDSAYPNYIKVGKTINIENRLAAYNRDRPLNTCSFSFIVPIKENLDSKEQELLLSLKELYTVSANSKEWFYTNDLAYIMCEVSRIANK